MPEASQIYFTIVSFLQPRKVRLKFGVLPQVPLGFQLRSPRPRPPVSPSISRLCRSFLAPSRPSGAMVEMVGSTDLVGHENSRANSGALAFPHTPSGYSRPHIPSGYSHPPPRRPARPGNHRAHTAQSVPSPAARR